MKSLLPESPAIYSVVITYDAANAFGASLRDKELCQFTTQGIDELPSSVITEGAVTMLRGQTDPETGQPEPCCLSLLQKKPTDLGLPKAE